MYFEFPNDGHDLYSSRSMSFGRTLLVRFEIHRIICYELRDRAAATGDHSYLNKWLVAFARAACLSGSVCNAIPLKDLSVDPVQTHGHESTSRFPSTEHFTIPAAFGNKSSLCRPLILPIKALLFD